MTIDDPRFLVIGRISAKHWSAVVTYRDEDIRIISVRRSRLGVTRQSIIEAWLAERLAQAAADK